MGNTLEIVKAMVKPTEKLIDAVQGAIGKAYEPRHKRKMADATAYEITTIGQAMRENSDIPIVYDKGAVGMDIVDGEDFVKRTQNRLAYQELTKQYNIESVVDNAYDILESNEDVSSEPIDPDWMIRFFNSVQDVSNLQMQELWSKILAGEIKKPSTFSMRTLDALHNITTEEARLFQKICEFKVQVGCYIFIPAQDDLLDKYGIKFEDVLKLEECGLVSVGGFLSIKRKVSKELSVLTTSTNNVIIIKSSDENDTNVSLSHYPLTAVGKELSGLFAEVQNDSYILDYARIIKQKNKNIIITAHKIEARNINGIVYDQTDLLNDD